MKSARQLQWLVFYFLRQTTELIVYVPLFRTDFNRFTGSSSPCFSQKLFRAFAKADETEGSPFSIFSTLQLFSIFFAFKGSPFKFFDILQQTELLKSPSVYILKYFRPIRLFQIKTLIFLFFSNNFFVTKGPLQLFATNWIFKKFRRSPFCHFKTPNKCVRPQPNPRFSQVCLARLKLVEAPFLTTLQVPNLSANLL